MNIADRAVEGLFRDLKMKQHPLYMSEREIGILILQGEWDAKMFEHLVTGRRKNNKRYHNTAHTIG